MAFHGIYISVVDIHINVADMQNQIVVKVFADDLQAAILNELNEQIQIEASPSKDEMLIIAEYFNNHMEISTVKGNIELSLDKAEKEADTFWVYFVLPDNMEATASMRLTVDYFQELFPMQTHIINARISDSAIYRKMNAKTTSINLH